MELTYKDLIMVQDTVLVKQYEPRFKDVITDGVDMNDPKNIGKNPKKDIMVMSKKTEKVMYNQQTVEILAVPVDNRLGLIVHDIVVVDWRMTKEFDLLPDTYAVSLYDIKTKVNREVTL